MERHKTTSKYWTLGLTLQLFVYKALTGKQSKKGKCGHLFECRRTFWN